MPTKKEVTDTMLNALNNIYRFIQQFIKYWRDYPEIMEFIENHSSPELIEQAKQNGEFDIYSSRFRYAWRIARHWWGHRDFGGYRCKKNKYDCEHCSAKHC